MDLGILLIIFFDKIIILLNLFFNSKLKLNFLISLKLLILYTR